MQFYQRVTGSTQLVFNTAEQYSVIHYRFVSACAHYAAVLPTHWYVCSLLETVHLIFSVHL